MSSQTPARFFLAFSVSISCAPSANSSRNAGDLGAASAGRDDAQPTGRHQVDEEDELAVVGGEEKPLAAPLGPTEATALERVERRVERLQRGDVRGAGLGDREGRHRVVELPPPRLHLRKLGHEVTVAR